MGKMRVILAGAAAAALAIGSAAPAQVTQYRSTPKAESDPAKLICERVQEIGSRVAKRRVCLTAEQWKEKHREHAEFAEDIQSGTWGEDSGDPPLTPQGPGPQ